MQGCIGEHGIEWLGKIETGGIAQNEPKLGKVLTSIGQHIRGVVESGNLSAAARDFRGELAGAAADIENSFAALRIQDLQKPCAIAPHE
jgi:hypothetical protein